MTYLETSTMISHVDDAMAEQLLTDLVNIPSPSYEEASAVRLLVRWMESLGYEQAFVDEAGNAVGILGSGPRTVVLLGHIDAFDGMPPVYRDGRRLYGRGTVDAKGPLCAFAVAARRAHIPTDVRLVVIGAVEEEAVTSKGARYAITQYQPDFCIIGEPSRWDRITLGYKGRLVAHWRWHGALAHSATEVPTGPERAFAYWSRVQKLVANINAERPDSLFQRLDVTLQAIDSQQEGAYGTACMTIGLRLPPGLTPETCLALLSDVLGEAETMTATGHVMAYVSPNDHALCRVLRGAIRAEGGTPRYVHKTGTADMNLVGPAWACPIVAYGPGDSSLDHTPDEHIELDEYLSAVRVLTRTIEAL